MQILLISVVAALPYVLNECNHIEKRMNIKGAAVACLLPLSATAFAFPNQNQFGVQRELAKTRNYGGRYNGVFADSRSQLFQPLKSVTSGSEIAHSIGAANSALNPIEADQNAVDQIVDQNAASNEIKAENAAFDQIGAANDASNIEDTKDLSLQGQSQWERITGDELYTMLRSQYMHNRKNMDRQSARTQALSSPEFRFHSKEKFISAKDREWALTQFDRFVTRG